MKRRKLKISIIPHGTEKIKATRFFIIILPIIAIIILCISIFITTMTIINIGNIKDYRSIKKMRENIAILTIKNRESKKAIDEIEKGIKDLQKKTSDILPYYNYMSGIARSDTFNLNLPVNTDSLLTFSDYIILTYNSILETVKNPSYANKIPTIIPVNGWVFRDFGNVRDPYTETERFNPGIIIVANEGENVYAAGDGYVIFAGDKPKLGQTIIIKHTKDITTTYAHLSSIKIDAGKTVKKGEIIGYIGKSGKVLAPSLFFEITRNDKPINPRNAFLVPLYDLYDSLSINL